MVKINHDIDISLGVVRSDGAINAIVLYRLSYSCASKHTNNNAQKNLAYLNVE